jgi:coenzyme F420-0:L-glutamate ligase / coenzyme F420-1:gamma-L-glutamate ligase
MKTKPVGITAVKEVRIFGIEGLPEIHPGDDLAKILFARLSSARFPLEAGDIWVVTQKIVSKAEGAVLDLKKISPSPFARSVAKRTNKDPRLLEAVLRKSRRIVRMDRDIIICETRQGFICANAGVDKSNVPGKKMVSLLPADPDRSARKLHQSLKKYFKMPIPVIITDTFGRPWREGLTNVAIGVSGLNPLADLRGQKDPYGYNLQKTVIAVADEIASAAELVMGKNDRIPIAIVRGYVYQKSGADGKALLRPPEKDMFR